LLIEFRRLLSDSIGANWTCTFPNEKRAFSIGTIAPAAVVTMAPSTKAVRPQVGKKQSKISTFGRITKTASTTTSQKAHAAKIPPVDRVTEPTDSCLGAGKKRRYDAIDGEGSCNSEEQVTTPFLKKVRDNALRPASTLTYMS
jgi:hypothetical protein